MTGPVHVTGEVITSRKAGACRVLSLVAPGVAERFRPGTLVALSVGGARLGRRAMWVHRVRRSGGYGATIDLVVSPAGPGTRWLAALPVGSRLAVTGPLGRPFALPTEAARCLLAGEGYAAATLFPLVEVVGCGGISTAEDARSFLELGAVAVQVGTALLHDPTTVARMIADLSGDPMREPA